MLKSIKFLSEKSWGRAGGGTKLALLAPVILGPVPRILLQRVSNLVNKLALLLHKCCCWERGFSLLASKQRSVAFSNKVMDTRLPQPAGCGDKYDVSGLGSRLLRCTRIYGTSNGEGLHRPWCHKILGTDCASRLSMTGGRGTGYGNFIPAIPALLAFLCLFTTAAEAKICFLPVDGCDTKIITKVKDDNASSCQYDSQYKAEQGIGACEIAYSPDKSQRKKKCWYRMCNTQNSNIFSTYEDCKNNLTGTQKCESCGSCYKRVAG